MCGIAGVIGFDRRQVEPAVAAMMRALIHRGPDDEGYEELPLGRGEPVAGGHDAGPVAGFGFRRLSILDLTPAGHQPMFNRRTGDCLIFNGEIYNFRWLKVKLERDGIAVESTGDTEVLLKALSTWGERVLDELDGMFAFAFYEARRRRILVARDPFGIKPLYVSERPQGPGGLRGGIVFASEIRAVLASGLVSDELDPAGMATMLAYGAPQDPLTLHRAIRSFPAGSRAWIEGGGGEGVVMERPTRYWRFSDPVPPFAEADAVAKVEQLLNASVRDQCVSDVPIGVFLSGGIDSATMAALAARHSPNLHTFSVGFEGNGAYDETSDAAATARLLRTMHSQTILDDDWIGLQWRDWFKAADRPSIDGLNTFVVSGVVKDLGTTVALSGLGADELFGGYSHFRSIPQMQRWLRLAGLVPVGLRRFAVETVLARARRSKREKAADLVAMPATPIELAAGLRRVLADRELAMLGVKAGPLGLRPRFLPEAAYEPFRDSGGDAFREISQAECFLYMENTLLRDCDVNSMAHSLEVRVPFLGRMVSELATSLPGSMQAPRGSLPKHLLRAAVKNVLPDAVFSRPKKGFSLPIGAWMAGPVRDDCEDAIATLAACPAIDGAGVRRLWEEYRSDWAAVHWSRPLALVALGGYLRERR